MEKSYFLCSEELIKQFPEFECSKPFKSGYEYDTDNYYIALIDFQKVSDYYQKHINDDLWCRECVPVTMDVSKISLNDKNGLFIEIERKLGLTKENNRAMAIYNLSKLYKCNPIELVNNFLYIV